MALGFTERKRLRRSFGRIRDVAQMPNLIELQKSSYRTFLQLGVLPSERKDVGLQAIFQQFFPVHDPSGRAHIEFVRYNLDDAKHSEVECRERGLTYASALRATLRLVVWEGEESAERTIRDVKEQDIYICDIPLMTEYGTFIINGTERVIVSQMQRSPGVFFAHDDGRTHATGKLLYSAHVIPSIGSWLDFEFDVRDHLFVRIDRKRKFLASTFLMAIKKEDGSSMSRADIMEQFYDSYHVMRRDGGFFIEYHAAEWAGKVLDRDLIDADTGAVLASAGSKINMRLSRDLATNGLKHVVMSREEMLEKYLARDLIDLRTGIVIAQAGEELTEEHLQLDMQDWSEIYLLKIDHITVGGYMRSTLAADKCNFREEALLDIYRILRPGEPPTVEGAEQMLHSLLFDPARYNLSNVGRVKMNDRLGLNVTGTVLTCEDIVAILKVMHQLKDGVGKVDDIDNLGNRRVRSVGELIENQIVSGLAKTERLIRERMSSADIENAVPNDIVNAKNVSSAIREFFGLSQLSQFMDQTNPLSEITHKRRLSALGPGGISRDRAGFDVRDVHPTHYGRICPIETPEGQNIGLISSLSLYARINDYGFIETPYRRVNNGIVSDEFVYLSAHEEENYTIAQANAEIDDRGCFVEEFVNCRRDGEFIKAARQDINFMDVSPKQLVSVAASLIPFLENDDASRALMGSNMQRQAVPLVRAQAPLVGTGLERTVARDSGAVIVAKRDGVVDYVDGNRIVIVAKEDESVLGVDVYNLRKFERSNQSTCINQKALVSCGDVVRAGDVIADGSGTDLGELALGHNVLVGFSSWKGYNFEDAIIISERLVQNDYFTSIHISEFEIAARDTKLGSEEITRDIPNLGDEALRHLDESGIIHIGSEVKAGDILVGKVTPKGESPMTPEEKLLIAIFREKSTDVKDSSLRVPPGVSGVVVGVKILSRKGVDKDERAIAIEQHEIERLKKDYHARQAILERNYHMRLKGLIMGEKIGKSPVKTSEKTVTEEYLASMPAKLWPEIEIKSKDVASAISALNKEHEVSLAAAHKDFENMVEKIIAGDELSPGVLKVVKVYIASKRKLQRGDKLAGRHGNKGVVSRIMPVEDMPHLEDGTPLDIILNPLGVPSRMNVGQILETHIGWASMGLGKKVRHIIESVTNNEEMLSALRAEMMDVYSDSHDEINNSSDDEVIELAANVANGVPVAVPVFDGARQSDIEGLLRKAGLDVSGQVTLIDGMTGEPFQRKVTVGCIYMMKLNHMVDDKMHARSIGPYSLVTQQPLGGKAQFGGQRFGEMEVWALQSYGAAYTLQEMLTVKSDDVIGRTKAYESIIRGEESMPPGIPESFNVLTKELCALGLNFEFQRHDVSEEM